MREIKFRGFYKKYRGQMCSEIGDGTMENDGVNSIIKKYQEDEDWEVMQYTGLQDKNGKEIYEGDIVRHKDSGHFFNTKVEYGKSGYNPFADGRDDINFCNVENTECVVIGNIFENKNLI